MKISKRIIPTLLATAVTCAAHAESSRPSLFQCVFKPGGATKVEKAPSFRRATVTTIHPQALKQREEEIDFAPSTTRWLAMHTVGRHHKPPALTIAEIECRW
jgi:hypothetical protein